MKSSETIGQRVARYRHYRGYSQSKLANLAATTRDTIASIEIDRTNPSTSMLGSIANALEIDIERLRGTRLDDPEALHDMVATVRRALAATDLVVADIEPRPLPELRREVAQLGEWRRATKYAKIGSALPGLVDELLVAASNVGEPAYAMLTGAYRAANTLGHKMGYADLSLTAVERMEWAAGRAGDPLLEAMTHYLRAAALARIGASKQAMVLLGRTIDAVQPLASTDPMAAAVYSALHMKAGVIAAALSDRDASNAHLEEAATFAGQDRVVHETVVGPTNVQLHRLAAAVDLGDFGTASAIADAVKVPDGYAKERTAYRWIDTARAFLGAGDTERAVEALFEAKEAAPEHFQASAAVKSAIRTAAAQERRVGTRGLRALANFAGVED